MKSSLGFHTLELSRSLTRDRVEYMIRDIREYVKKHGCLQVYPERNVPGNRIYVMKINDRDYGIKWKFHKNVWLRDYGLVGWLVDVEINPKTLGGIKDYITASNINDMPVAIENFDKISYAISPQLSGFNSFRLKRIDYCINFDISELGVSITPQMMIELIKKSNIPYHFKEWQKYDPVSHRMKGKPGSFYLLNHSVTINCYSKYKKFQEQNKSNIANGFSPIPEEWMSAAYNIIRFEIQYKPNKIQDLNRIERKRRNFSVNKYKEYLSTIRCEDVIRNYYNNTIGGGDWYSLPKAKKIILDCDFNVNKKNRLIEALEIISEKRSIESAKKYVGNSHIMKFNSCLKELSEIGINPVSIPKQFHAQHVPNLLTAYFIKRQSEETFLMRE